MNPELLSNSALVGSACVLGAMLFFSTTVAPLVFMRLPSETAGKFIRSLFPHYYLNLAAVSFLALAAALLSGVWESIYLAALAAVAGGFIVARQWMMPRINHWRDAASRDDSVAPRQFKRWHAASVILNAAQMLALAFICFGVDL